MKPFVLAAACCLIFAMPLSAFVAACKGIVAGFFPTIRRMKAMMAILVIAVTIPLSACGGGGGGGTAAMSPSSNMPGDGMSPMMIPLPTPSSARTLADLNAYDMPTPLAANQIRAGGDAANVGDITGFRYDDADGNPRILVEKLDFAHLGIWITGDIADNNFAYANVANHGVIRTAGFSGLSTATYAYEGDMTYKGVRFYPDGSLTVNFSRGSVRGTFNVDGASNANHFGGANIMVPNGVGGMRPVAATDSISANIGGIVTVNGFGADFRIDAVSGFFADFRTGFGTTPGSSRDIIGRFHHGNDFISGTTTPTEISGTLNRIRDRNGLEMNGGFLGQCTSGC